MITNNQTKHFLKFRHFKNVSLVVSYHFYLNKMTWDKQYNNKQIHVIKLTRCTKFTWYYLCRSVLCFFSYQQDVIKSCINKLVRNHCQYCKVGLMYTIPSSTVIKRWGVVTEKWWGGGAASEIWGAKGWPRFELRTHLRHLSQAARNRSKNRHRNFP